MAPIESALLYNQQVHVAVGSYFSARGGPEKNDPLRTRDFHNSPNDLIQNVLSYPVFLYKRE